MTTLSESLFPPSNRRRCSKGRPSYIEPTDISVPNEEIVLENSESSINESFMYDDNSTSENLNDEEETGIDLCAFMMENPELAQPALENPADAEVDNSHSKFRVTSCEMDPTPIVLDNTSLLNPDIKIPNSGLDDSVVSTVSNPNQISMVPLLDKTEFPAGTEIGSLPRSVNDSVSGKENVIFVNGQKQTAKPFPKPRPRIFKKFSKFKPHAMKDVNKPSFAAKEINRTSLALFGKFPLVKCEKLDVEKFIKNNHDIKLVNWPYIPQKKTPKFKTTGNLNNKNSLLNKRSNIGKETKVGKPIFKKPNFQQQIVVSESLLTSSSYKSPYSMNSKAVIIKTNKWEPEITNAISSPFMHVNNTHVQSSSILFNENQPVVREPSKVIRIFSSNSGDAHQNSIAKDTRQPIITNVKNFGNQPKSIRIFRQVASKPAVSTSGIIQQQKVGTSLPISDNFTVIEPCNYTVIEPYVERDIKTMSAIEASSPIPTAVSSIPKLITNDTLTVNNNRKLPLYPVNKCLEQSTCGQTGFLAKPAVQISPKNARKSSANKTDIMQPLIGNYKRISKVEDAPVVEEDFMKLAVLKAQNTVENAIKSAFSTGRKKRNSKSFERKSDMLQSTVKESALIGCQAYNTTLNDILFGCGSLEEDDYIDVEEDYSAEENIYSSNSMEDKISEQSDDELKESEISNLYTKHFTKFKKKVNFSNSREAPKIKLEPPDSDTLTASECGDESNDAGKIGHTLSFKANKKQRHLVANKQHKNISHLTQKPKFISSFERHRKSKNKKLRNKFFKRTPKIILALKGQCGKQSTKGKTISPTKIKIEKNTFHIKSEQSDAVTTEEEKIPSTKIRTVKRSPLKNRSSHRLKTRQQDSVTSEEETSVRTKVGKRTPTKHRLSQSLKLEAKDVVTSEDEALSSKEKLILDLKKISGQSLQKNRDSGVKKNLTLVGKKDLSSPIKCLINEECTPKSMRLKRLKKKNNLPDPECEDLKEQLRVKNIPLKVLFKKPQKAKKSSIPSATNVMLERSKNAKRNNKLLNSTFRREDETNIPVTNSDEESSNEPKIDAVTSDSNSDMPKDFENLDNDNERVKEKSVPEEDNEDSIMKGELNQGNSAEICDAGNNVVNVEKYVITDAKIKETKNSNNVCDSNVENSSTNKESHLNLSEESSNSSELCIEKVQEDDVLNQSNLENEVVGTDSENLNNIGIFNRESNKEESAHERVDDIHSTDEIPSFVENVFKPVDSISELQEGTLCLTENASSLTKSTSEPAQKVSILEEDLDISESDSNSAGIVNPVDSDSSPGNFGDLLIIDSSSEDTVSVPAESIEMKAEEVPESRTEIRVENTEDDFVCENTDFVESSEKHTEGDINSNKSILETSDKVVPNDLANIENSTERESDSNLLTVETERACSDENVRKLARKKCPKIKISISKRNLSGNLEKTDDLNNWYISERKDSTDSTVSDMTPEEVEIKKQDSLKEDKVVNSDEKESIIATSDDKKVVDLNEKDKIVQIFHSDEKVDTVVNSDGKDAVIVDLDKNDIVDFEEKDEIVVDLNKNGEPVEIVEKDIINSQVKNNFNSPVKGELDDTSVKSKHNSLIKDNAPAKAKLNSSVKDKDKLNSPIKDKVVYSQIEDTDSKEENSRVDSIEKDKVVNSPAKNKLVPSPIKDLATDPPEKIIAADSPVKDKSIVSLKKDKIIHSGEKKKLNSSSLSSKDELLNASSTKKQKTEDQGEIDVTTVDTSCSSQGESETNTIDTIKTKKGNLEDKNLKHKKKNSDKQSPESTKPAKKVSSPEIKSIVKGTSQIPSPNSSNMKKRYSPELVVVPFKFGWMREIVSRATETTKGARADVYYFTPEGVKLRSMPEISNYLSKHKDGELTLQNFTFAKEAVYREPFEVERNAKQKSTILSSPAMRKGKAQIKKEMTSDFTPPTSTKSTPNKNELKEGKKKKADSFAVSPSPKRHKSNKSTPEKTVTPSRPLRTIIKKVPFDNSEEKTQTSNLTLETRARTSSYVIKKEISPANEEEPLESNLKVTSSSKKRPISVNVKNTNEIAKRAKIKYAVSRKSEMVS